MSVSFWALRLFKKTYCGKILGKEQLPLAHSMAKLAQLKSCGSSILAVHSSKDEDGESERFLANEMRAGCKSLSREISFLQLTQTLAMAGAAPLKKISAFSPLILSVRELSTATFWGAKTNTDGAAVGAFCSWPISFSWVGMG